MQVSEANAKSSQSSGDFVLALKQWLQVEQHWRAALLNGIEQQRLRKFALVGELVTIPEGSFLVGSDGDNNKSEELVAVSSFKMQVHEVTGNQYFPCVEDLVCPPLDHEFSIGDFPVIFVRFEDITDYYIPWLNSQTGEKFRLPTDAEWEYAARAGSTTKYSWGNSIGNNRANCDGCGSRWDKKRTAPVKSFSPNAFGLYDMHGNVAEWTHECIDYTYKYCNGSIARGGSWQDEPSYLRSGTRKSYGMTRWYHIGFRLVQDI